MHSLFFFFFFGAASQRLLIFEVSGLHHNDIPQLIKHFIIQLMHNI